MDKSQAVWNATYEKILRDGRTFTGDPWLRDWLHLVPKDGPQRALEVGCGFGHNSSFLLGQGYEVTAIDFSEHALELCRREAPNARIEWADLRVGLPFDDEQFELIVADLSLHYFYWEITTRIITDITRRLVPGGIFAGRFNSTGDTNYGANSKELIQGESNLLIVDGIEKRFFTRDCFNQLLGPPLKAVSVEEKRIVRFGPSKVLWEVLAEKI